MEPETVVLVHGLWVHGIAMALLRRRITRCGFRAYAYSYPSMRLTLAENTERLARYCRGLDVPRISLVGHSLGGLIVLRMLERCRDITPGRVVLMGAPVSESYSARCLARLPGGRAALGRSLTEWLDAGPPVPNESMDIGVVAGTLAVGLGRIVAPDLPAPSDGAVSVAETRLPTMRDHIALNVSHSGMLVSRVVAQQICAFLRQGAFEHQERER